MPSSRPTDAHTRIRSGGEGLLVSLGAPRRPRCRDANVAFTSQLKVVPESGKKFVDCFFAWLDNGAIAPLRTISAIPAEIQSHKKCIVG
jgi:hypothetical protein